MNTTTKLLSAAAALTLFAACSSDEPAVSGPISGGGEKTYVNVRLNSNQTRSTDYGENGNFEFGDEFEHKVTSAKFFFFDEKGNYVLDAKLATPTFDGPSQDQDNVEWISTENVLVLEDQTANTLPTYMMTVLNMPDFEAAETIDATARKLSIYAENFKKEGNNFVMTTSSYKGDASDINHDNAFYQVTRLDKDNFRATKEDALNANPVDVYVERLAAKVQVKMGAKVKGETSYTDENGVEHKIYKLEQTIAGSDNDHNNGNPGNSTANTEIYVEVLGWGLNATAKESYMSKIFDTKWLTTDPYKFWNDGTRFRSYWAYSYPYSFGPNVAEGETLNYITPDELTGTLNSTYAEYCYENTNAAGNLYITSNEQNLVYNDRVTHVILKTRICDVKGNTLPMVSFRGTLFHEKAFLAYVARILRNGTNKLNYYYLTSGTEAEGTYLQVSQDNFELVALDESYEKAEIKLKGLEGKKLYAKSINSEGKEVYTPITNGLSLLAADVAAVYNNSSEVNSIYWYKDGSNIYFIPIEHNTSQNRTLANEGYYGVVRNHWYELSINSFSHVGNALNDPDSGKTEIKPDKPKDPLYYVGAEINILSWRIISQGVDL